MLQIPALNSIWMAIINKRVPHSLSLCAAAARKNIHLEGLSYEWVELHWSDCVPYQSLARWIKLPLICYVSGKDEMMFMGSPMASLRTR